MAYDGLPAVVFMSSYIVHNGYSVGAAASKYFHGTTSDQFINVIEGYSSLNSNDQVVMSPSVVDNSSYSNDSYESNIEERNNSSYSNDGTINNYYYESLESETSVNKITPVVIDPNACPKYAPYVCEEIYNP